VGQFLPISAFCPLLVSEAEHGEDFSYFRPIFGSYLQTLSQKWKEGEGEKERREKGGIIIHIGDMITWQTCGNGRYICNTLSSNN